MADGERVSADVSGYGGRVLRVLTSLTVMLTYSSCSCCTHIEVMWPPVQVTPTTLPVHEHGSSLCHKHLRHFIVQ
jgi:hypothetical protein